MLRPVPWASVGGCSLLGAVVLAGCVAYAADGPMLGYARVALVALAAAAAFVFDDPAAAAVRAVPTSNLRRTAARTVAAVVPLIVWLAGVGAMALRSPDRTPVADLVVEGVGVIAVAVALATVGCRLGLAEPGELVASCLGAVLLGVALFDPSPWGVPIFSRGSGWTPSTTLWSVIAVASVLVVTETSREPVRGPRLRWR